MPGQEAAPSIARRTPVNPRPGTRGRVRSPPPRGGFPRPVSQGSDPAVTVTPADSGRKLPENRCWTRPRRGGPDSAPATVRGFGLGESFDPGPTSARPAPGTRHRNTPWLGTTDGPSRADSFRTATGGPYLHRTTATSCRVALGLVTGRKSREIGDDERDVRPVDDRMDGAGSPPLSINPDYRESGCHGRHIGLMQAPHHMQEHRFPRIPRSCSQGSIRYRKFREFGL